MTFFRAAFPDRSRPALGKILPFSTTQPPLPPPALYSHNFLQQKHHPPPPPTPHDLHKATTSCLCTDAVFSPRAAAALRPVLSAQRHRPRLQSEEVLVLRKPPSFSFQETADWCHRLAPKTSTGWEKLFTKSYRSSCWLMLASASGHPDTCSERAGSCPRCTRFAASLAAQLLPWKKRSSLNEQILHMKLDSDIFHLNAGDGKGFA